MEIKGMDIIINDDGEVATLYAALMLLVKGTEENKRRGNYLDRETKEAYEKGKEMLSKLEDDLF
ncbi:hypothetical protein [Lentibacillus amyloliquefaciens]|uniref:Uncharacterized protein n=1 Tax=Lentibacillus amyloliquefaciens TaxID=1472767 RepID=A0A0U4DYI7_9BACI|nr:hypothetical protein [Lentibacillus amyloliquefaciens]ALX50456.1 hypothetical protein AOX59_18845 [Lentibacillus amyloliquefaciens]